MAQLGENFEAELRMALAEGILSQEEGDALREEARRLGRSPLELLREKGRLSEGTLLSLMAQVRDAQGRGVGHAEETATLGGKPAGTEPPPEAPGVGHAEETATVDGLAARREPTSEAPAFPVSDWDRYQHVRFLGQGGMGRVFLAYDPRLRRNVALKFVRDEDAEHTRRFISEARSQARVSHERVCKVYEVGEVQGRVFIAMQYIEGQPLNALARELSVEQKAMVLRESALAVHEAHRVGLIHRDLKPSNIMVERDEDGALKPYVMDFGLARDWTEQGTADGTVLGTPHYMAPEQARGEVATMDRRADVYSLGATLYHLLTGQPPIPGSNGLEVVSRIATEEPRQPRALNPDLPADLEAITLKCLEKDRSARYDSARALAEDLERFLSGEPVQARAAGLGYRLRKKLRKHRAMVSVASVALALVVLALGWAGLQRREVVQRERLARRFTELVERVESMARYSDLSPLHDTREDRQAIRARMDELDAEIREAGPQAVGPGHHALGRGYLALGDEAKAREHLESAWASGFREPRVAYALALVLGHQYQEQLLEAERIRGPERREAQKREIERRYRDPALAYLKQSQGAEVPSPEYVAALLAFYEGRLDDALARLEAMGRRLPWFYEAPKLRGDILLARATQRWNAGEREGALADFEAGREAYATAASIGESVPAVHDAMAELEYAVMVMELYGQGNVMPPFAQGLQALARALVAAPDDFRAKLLEARLYRRLAEHRTNQGAETREPVEKAVAAARAAVSLAPSRSDARLELGRAFWQWGRALVVREQDPREPLQQATGVFESLRPEDRDYEFHRQLGLVFNDWADYEEQSGADPTPHRTQAIAAFQAAIQLNDRLMDAWTSLGTSYFSKGSLPRNPDADADLERARVALDKARTLNPQHVVPYFYIGEVQVERASRLRARNEDTRPTLELATAMYQKGIEINPRLPQLYYGLARALTEQAKAQWDLGGDPFPLLAKARATYEQAITIAPENGLGHSNLGDVLALQAHYRRLRGEDPGPSVRAAAESCEKAIQRLPNSVLPWSNLGMSYSILATFELERGLDPRRSLVKAEEALHQALARNSNHVQTWRSLGEVRQTSARWQAQRGARVDKAFEAAAEAFQKALELAPERQENRLALAHHLHTWADWLGRTGRDSRPLLRRGATLSEEALSARPRWADALLLRGLVLLALANTEASAEQRREWSSRAVDDFAQALSANPNLERRGRGEALLAQRLLANSRPSTRDDQGP